MHVSAANLDYVVPLLRFRSNRIAQRANRGNQARRSR